jgi:hypothetical protein
MQYLNNFNMQDEVDYTKQWTGSSSLSFLPASQRLRPRKGENSTGILSGMLFFDAMGEAVLKNSRLTEVGKAIRNGVIPKLMSEHLDLLDSDFILQVDGAGPSLWSDSTSSTSVGDYIRNSLSHQSITKPDTPDACEESSNNHNTSLKRRTKRLRDKRSHREMARDTGDEVASSPKRLRSLTSDESRDLDDAHRRIKELEGILLRLPQTQQPTSPLRERYSARLATNFMSAISEMIACVRANIDPSFLHVLDNHPDYRESEETNNLLKWWTTLQEKTYFAVVDRDTFAADLHRTLASAVNPYFNYVKSNVTFDILSARYVSAYRALKLADPTTKESRMVTYLIDNLPASNIFKEARAKLKARSMNDPNVVSARNSLSLAIQFFNEEIHLQQSLTAERDSFLPDENESGATKSWSDKRIGGAATKQDTHAGLIMHISSRLDQIAKQNSRANNKADGEPAKGSKLVEPVYDPCRQFTKSNSCRFGDGCKFLHNLDGKPDHRLDQKGVFRRQFLDSMGKRPSAKAVILSLQAQVRSLKNKHDALDVVEGKPNLLGVSVGDDVF